MGAGNRRYFPAGSTVAIEAVRHIKGNHALALSMGATVAPDGTTTVVTKDGACREVKPGEWIVRDSDGSFRTSDHQTFAANHVPVS